jgi:hypothetical protein
MRRTLAVAVAVVVAVLPFGCHAAKGPVDEPARAGDEASDDGQDGPEGDDPLPVFSAAPHSPASSIGARLHAEARRQLASMRSTRYVHETSIDEALGRYEYDCSGFVDYAIGNVVPDALDPLRALEPKSRRPKARAFVALLSAIAPGGRSGRWRRLATPSELDGGDVVAWLAPERAKDFTGALNTGHVMIVDGRARARGQDEWLVPVIDSSVGHGGADKRKAPDATGLGRGDVVLVVRDGAVVGFRRTVRKKANVWTSTVVMGRIE